MRRKTIPIPGIHDVNIAPILPLVDHPLFQQLRFKRQLSLGNFVFPSANHTRFEHALGVYSLTRERAERWVEDGCCTEQTARDLALFGLLHDIGHGPYSHLSEDFCRTDHNQRGLKLLQQLRRPIEKCGGKFSQVCDLFSRTSDLSAGVSHHPLGTDKLDYLARDARHTNESVTLTLGVLLNYVHFDRDELVADSTILDEVMQAQRSYVYMYGRVYWRKTCLIAERVLQKMLGRMLKIRELSNAGLMDLTDTELDAVVLGSQDAIVRSQWQRLLARRFPKQAVVFSTNPTAQAELASGKPTAVETISTDELNQLESLQQATVADRVEEDIAYRLGIPEEAVAVTPPKPVHRFLPPDIPIINGRRERSGTLYTLRPEHFAVLQELAATYTAVRVCVYEEHRELAARSAGIIKQCLLSGVS